VTTVAINQPCYLPWRGQFALMKVADVFVFYDDVQFTTTRKFFSRVQIKTATGRRWLTVPVQKSGRYGQRIDEAVIADDGWATRHCGTIREALRDAPYITTIEPTLAVLTSRPWQRLADLSIATTLAMAPALGAEGRTLRSSQLGIEAAGTDRLLGICRALGATHYITGHGGLAYLDHEAFESAGIAVEYMDYDLSPYPQQHGPFEPYVTALDLLANTGRDAVSHVNAHLIPWREMVARHAATVNDPQ
jgi:WbqC-like protein family